VSDAQLRQPKPESLEAKFKLMTLLPFDKRAKRKHLLVYGFVLDWFHSKYGDALASSRHVLAELKSRDPFGHGLYMGDVHSALTELVSWGYLSQEKGAGRRASRYVPVWSKFDSVRNSMNTTYEEASVRETPNMSVRETPNTKADSVHNSPNEDPSTPTRSQDQGTGVDGLECAPASPPPAAAPLGGATAERAQGFEELWRAYGHKQKKAEAKAAYAKLAPEGDLHARMVTAAANWFERWAAQGKKEAPRFSLAKWIDREEYDCEPPTAYKRKERQARTEEPRPASPANDNPKPMASAIPRASRRMVNDVGPFSPFGDFDAEIVGSRVERVGATTERVVLQLNWSGHEGFDAEHTFYYQHPMPSIQERGQAFVQRLAECTGIGHLSDTEQLHGRRVRCVINERLAISYDEAA